MRRVDSTENKLTTTHGCPNTTNNTTFSLIFATVKYARSLACTQTDDDKQTFSRPRIRLEWNCITPLFRPRRASSLVTCQIRISHRFGKKKTTTSNHSTSTARVVVVVDSLDGTTTQCETGTMTKLQSSPDSKLLRAKSLLRPGPPRQRRVTSLVASSAPAAHHPKAILAA